MSRPLESGGPFGGANMSGKKKKRGEEAESYTAQLSEHFEAKPDSAPPRADGRPWPIERLLAAERRAAGKKWSEIAAIVQRSEPTCRHWVDPDFVRLVAWFEERLLFARRELWLREEQTLCVEGLRQAHATYARIMRGEPDSAGNVPGAELQLRAAREYFEAIGYTDARRLIARAEIAAEQGSGADGASARGAGGGYDAPAVLDIGIKGL